MRKADITYWEGNLLQVSIPMNPPLQRVNSYLLPDREGGIALIDPGPRSPEAELAWEGALRELGLSWDRVQDIVITHHHPDHYGLAGWMQDRCGGKVWMSERASEEAEMTWGKGGTLKKTLPEFFARHGLPERCTVEIEAHLDSFNSQVTPAPEVTFLDAAALFGMGGREWQPIVTGGHAPGHVSFYHEEERIMLCGDAVLPQISPNVSLLPGSDPQPLQSFLQGLQELRRYPAERAFPGHRAPFSGLTERIDSLLQHHEERLERVWRLLADGPLSGYEVCEALFRGRVSGVHQLRFAMSEALAHLEELVRRERAIVLDSGASIRYAAV